MLEVKHTKGFTIKARPRDYAVLKTAAVLSGKRLTEFCRDAALVEARAILKQHKIEIDAIEL